MFIGQLRHTLGNKDNFMRSEFHIHTLYCDGKNTCEEIVLKALEKGFDAIGFSGHSYTDFDKSYCMSRKNTALYVNEVRELKNKYKDKIRIYCGIEQDIFAPEQNFEPDYIIGSVHYVLKDGIYIPVDESREKLVASVKEYYGGDFYAFAKDYFGEVGNVAKITDCDIIGHFDLVSKFNEGYVLFDENDSRYVSLWHDALDELIKAGRIFEVNTGAISRGYRSTPYPREEMLRYIAEKNGTVTITSDCHNAEKLGFAYGESFELIKRTGVEYVDFAQIFASKNI